MQGVGVCPSFSTYSSGTMSDIAARVVEELRNEPQHPDTLNLFHSSLLQSPKTEQLQEEQEDDEFEFSFLTTNGSPISADQIFSNGLIKPSYPLFNTDLLNDAAAAVKTNGEGKKTARTPLGKLMMMNEERETTTSSSSCSSSDNNLKPASNYCDWAPKKVVPDTCKKSRSTGSSMRWRLRELLHRSNSDRKDTRVDVFEKSRTVKEGGAKRRTYLPYKHELVGLFSNVNGLGRNLRPF